MALPIVPLALAAFDRIRDSWAGRILAALAALLLLRAWWKREGAAEASDAIDRNSNAAARRRREKRDEIDLDMRRIGAADRLRKHWARD